MRRVENRAAFSTTTTTTTTTTAQPQAAGVAQ